MNKTSKPNTTEAMLQVVKQSRQAIPFGLTEAEMCSGVCHGCSKKMLDFLEMELQSWEYRLNQGEIPSFGDIKKLTNMSYKIHRALGKSGLLTHKQSRTSAKDKYVDD